MTTKKLYRQVMYMEEEETPPKISLKPTSIDFGTVGYSRSAARTLEVKNVGKVSGEEKKGGDLGPCSPSVD